MLLSSEDGQTGGNKGMYNTDEPSPCASATLVLQMNRPLVLCTTQMNHPYVLPMCCNNYSF